MSFFSNHLPVLLGVYDNELSVSYFPPNNNGKLLGRDALENMHHAGGLPELHPTLSNVIKNTNGHIFVAGSFQFEWRWDPADMTQQDVDAYVSLLESQLPLGATVTTNHEQNKVLFDLADANYAIPEWTGQLIQWHPKVPYATITNTSDESEFLCVTRLNGTYNEYTFDQRTIEPNETLSFDRPACDKCFVMFTGDVIKGDTVLAKNKLYKVTSTSIEVTNTGTTRVKVLRYTKA
jgi:hypothetical protein